mgnify:CR=1 FL=1
MGQFSLLPTHRVTTAALLLCGAGLIAVACSKAAAPPPSAAKPAAAPTFPKPTEVSILAVAQALNECTKDGEICITKLPLGWNGAYRHFKHPLDYLGADGGGGVGAGPGLTVGAALALQGSGRLAVGLCGDGDFLTNFGSYTPLLQKFRNP